MQLTFAVFHVDVPSKVIEDITKFDPEYILGKPKEMLRALFGSARRFHPECRTVVLTDEKTQFPGLPKNVELYRYSLDNLKIMLSRSKAQLEFIQQTNGESHIVFLDPDILIQKDLLPLFDKNFDVGLTYRHRQTQFNSGVILINGRGWNRAYIFMERIYNLVRDRYIEWQAWYGSELALMEALRVPSTIVDQIIIVSHDWGMRILLLPASTYNYISPDFTAMDGYYPDKAILHFMEERKIQLLPYYEKYIKIAD